MVYIPLIHCHRKIQAIWNYSFAEKMDKISVATIKFKTFLFQPIQ